jgi:hypothetical protein
MVEWARCGTARWARGCATQLQFGMKTRQSRSRRVLLRATSLPTPQRSRSRSFRNVWLSPVASVAGDFFPPACWDRSPQPIALPFLPPSPFPPLPPPPFPLSFVLFNVGHKSHGCAPPTRDAPVAAILAPGTQPCALAASLPLHASGRLRGPAWWTWEPAGEAGTPIAATAAAAAAPTATHRAVAAARQTARPLAGASDPASCPPPTACQAPPRAHTSAHAGKCSQRRGRQRMGQPVPQAPPASGGAWAARACERQLLTAAAVGMRRFEGVAPARAAARAHTSPAAAAPPPSRQSPRAAGWKTWGAWLRRAQRRAHRRGRRPLLAPLPTARNEAALPFHPRTGRLSPCARGRVRR